MHEVSKDQVARAKARGAVRDWWRKRKSPQELPWPKPERDSDEAFRAAGINFGWR
jgi:hypothetical protein